MLRVAVSWAQVEIKLRLADRAAHERVAQALRPAFRETHHQENYFFDGAKRELSSRRCVMRCRFYNTDKRALLTVKARPPCPALPCLSFEHDALLRLQHRSTTFVSKYRSRTCFFTRRSACSRQPDRS